jgi:hypothetical protein
MSEKIATEYIQCDFEEYGSHQVKVDLYSDGDIDTHCPEGLQDIDHGCVNEALQYWAEQNGHECINEYMRCK